MADSSSDPHLPVAESPPAPPTIVDRLRWNSTPELHETIRRLWIDHSKAEDSRNLDGLIATLATDCVYEIVPTGQKWEGHEAGALPFNCMDWAEGGTPNLWRPPVRFMVP